MAVGSDAEDISKALIPGGDTPLDAQSEDDIPTQVRRGAATPPGKKCASEQGDAFGHTIGDLDAGTFNFIDEDGDDDSFIAARQAASNRKASNLKGRTVKKGGGFQAMGMISILKEGHEFLNGVG